MARKAASSVGAPQAAVSRPGESVGRDAPAVQHDDAVGPLHFGDEMGGPEHRRAALGREREDVGHEVRPAARVEPLARLVEEQQPRRRQQRAGEFHLAPRAARQVPHPLGGEIADAEARQPVRDRAGGAAPPEAVQAGMEGEVLVRRSGRGRERVAGTRSPSGRGPGPAPSRCRRRTPPRAPTSATNSPVRIWNSVVLPAPLRPSSAVTEPVGTTKETSSSAFTPP